MEAFQYHPNPARVIFGSGTAKPLLDELRRLGLCNPLILSTPEQIHQAEDIEMIVSTKLQVAGVYSKAVMHTPVEVSDDAVKFAEFSNADSLISIGGGTTIGLGKAISLRTGLYHISIPTTYAGSEMTPILGETRDGKKTTRSDSKILPGSVIYDVGLTMTLPLGLVVVSGINAIAHAVEALYARDSNPIIDLMAIEGIRALAASLPRIISDPSSQPARSEALYGAWLCGTCLGSVGMSLHHKLCHVLGGSFGLPHAQTHTIVLPHALAYNAPKVPQAMEKLAAVLPGSDGDAVKGLNGLLNELDAPRSLKSLGMEEADIDKAVEIAVTNAYWNPREIEKEKIRELIRRAWAGEDARADL